MSLSAIVTTPIFVSDLFANSIFGIAVPKFAYAVAMGLEIYAQAGLSVQTADTGSLGVGTGAGIGMVLSPFILSEALTATFVANKIFGPMAPPEITGLSTAFSKSLLQATIKTSHTGVGIGTGIAILLPNSTSSRKAWKSGFEAAGISGPSAQQIIASISDGFDIAARFAVGAVVIVGPPSPSPGAGVGSGVLL